MTISSDKQAKEYLESFIRPSVFERIEGDSHMQDPLDRMRVLLSLLGDPQKDFKSVQVSGTSGKGSTSYLLANILTKAGYKTGLASSPHLERLSERMLINNAEITEEELLALMVVLVPAVEKLKKLPEGEPSYFELLTALAFLHFAKEKVDIAVVEVGLEGKYDATNVLDPLVVILTTISRDHTELLGSTEEAIAGEALSIIRKGEKTVPVVVTGITQKGIIQMVKDRADEIGARSLVLGKDMHVASIATNKQGIIFDYRDPLLNLQELSLSLRGEYQAGNAGLAIAALSVLRDYGLPVNEGAIRDGLAHAFFAGRFEVINYTLDTRRYTLILDGAHNEAKMGAFLKALDQYYPDEPTVFIVGFKKNKDSKSMIKQLFLRKGTFIFTQFHQGADYARNISMTEAELQANVKQVKQPHDVLFTGSVQEAFERAATLSVSIIVVTGSLYLVGEVRSKLITTE